MKVNILAYIGSWDGTIRVWDFRTQTCLDVIWDHHADVYGLSCNPLRPFVFASSSRDTTLRRWSMEKQAAVPRMMALFGVPWNNIVSEVDGVMKV